MNAVSQIRTKAVCVFRHNGKLLLSEGYDPTKKERFLIPVGGGVEFGEKSADAVLREIQEEISADVHNLRLLGIVENFFTFDSIRGHEVVFIYEADFLERSFYERETIEGIESNGQALVVRWFAENDIRNADVPVYPDGIVEMVLGQRCF